MTTRIINAIVMALLLALPAVTRADSENPIRGLHSDVVASAPAGGIAPENPVRGVDPRPANAQVSDPAPVNPVRPVFGDPGSSSNAPLGNPTVLAPEGCGPLDMLMIPAGLLLVLGFRTGSFRRRRRS